MLRLDAATLAVKWRVSIPAFNVSVAAIENGQAYVAGIGFVGAVDLEKGTYLWKHAGLYDRERSSFNAFERPVVGPHYVTFVEIRSDSQKPRRIVVHKITGAIRIEEPR